MIMKGYWGDAYRFDPNEPLSTANVEITKKDGKVFYLAVSDLVSIIGELVRVHKTACLQRQTNTDLVFGEGS